ncbi:MYH [Mytilus coruscus]|uniref:MYH n=1 Tax=Mytilus coruscus TaxID=42192 RepID=A0A6J8A2R7_MYTCO|nr:MYH [Mytilus coruscus]
MIVTAKSIDDENPELSMIARRGYGGVAILWKKEMDDKISVMVDGSNRIQVIQMKFLAENSLEPNQEYPEKETFFHHNGKSSGQIDYFFSASKDLTQYVQILDMEAENTSDHVPVIATIKRKLIRKSNKPKSVIVRTKWEKCNLQKYQKYQLTISDGVEKILQASNKNIEEDITSIEKEKHALWKNGVAPKDKNNPLKSQLTTAKRLIRKAHRQAYASQREKLSNQIMTASSSDNKLFHKLLRTQRSDGNRFTKTLRRDNQTAETNEDILHMWTDYFYELSNPDYKQNFDNEKYEISSLQNTIIEKIENNKMNQ